MTIGDRIREKRKDRRMTQEELAELSKTTKQNINKYENNVITNIPSDKIERIAKVLSVSPAYLMGWTENNEETMKSATTLDPVEREIIETYRKADGKQKLRIGSLIQEISDEIEKNNSGTNGNGASA